MSSSDSPTGLARLTHPALNKSLAFTEEERDRYRLRGLLPPRVAPQTVQIECVLENLRRKESDIERYIFLEALHSRNERLFYRVLLDHMDEIMPLVYTPTVGQACKEFAHIFREPRGFYITLKDKGRVRDILDNWPEKDVRVIVATDGERILGLGDLGANGMGIPIGKLALYTACAGIHPKQCLPVQRDAGTDNAELISDPLYLGLAQKRERGDAYLSLIDEFVSAARDAFPNALIQFEDFVTENAYLLLERFQDKTLCFNDDIQGTAGVAVAGVYAAARATQQSVKDMRIMFLGAGSASTGIADLMEKAFVSEGVPSAEAHRRLWLNDSKGLIVKGRDRVKPHAAHFAHEHPEMDFLTALRDIKPHILIGATGRANTFNREIIETMSSFNDQPIVFALSNPTANAEITAADAYRFSQGRVVFASGSPFPAQTREDGSTWRPGQGNNAYIFPGVGLGAIGCRAKTVTDSMFLVAARELADAVPDENLREGTLFPSLSEVRSVSLRIAVTVAEEAYDKGLALLPRPPSLRDHLAEMMYDPTY